MNITSQQPRGSRQMDMQACPLGSLLRGNRKSCTHHWKKGLCLLCTMALAAFPLSGCTLKSPYQKKQEQPQGELDVFKQVELTEKEMDQTHFSMQLRDKVKIDAKITPYHMYQNGAGSYYNLHGNVFHDNSNIIELNKKSKDAKLKDLTFFGKSVSTLLKLLETKDNRKPQTEKLKWKFHKKYGWYDVKVPFAAEKNEEDVTLDIMWDCIVDKEENPLLNSKKLHCRYFEINSDVGRQVQQLAVTLPYEYGVYSDAEKNLDFADSVETAQMLKEMLTKLTGYEYSDDYECLPVDSALSDSVQKDAAAIQQEIQSGDTTSLVEITKPCYYYCFYQVLDGLPVRRSSESIRVDENTNLEKKLRKEVENSYLKSQADHYCTPYAEIVYDDTGIIYLQFGDGFVSEEPCEEKQPLCNLSDLLEPLYDYFGTIANIDTTVYEIRLGYRATFTEGTDEPIRRLLVPVWIVKYDTRITGKRCVTVCFDGYTGERLRSFFNVN